MMLRVVALLVMLVYVMPVWPHKNGRWDSYHSTSTHAPSRT